MAKRGKGKFTDALKKIFKITRAPAFGFKPPSGTLPVGSLPGFSHGSKLLAALLKKKGDGRPRKTRRRAR